MNRPTELHPPWYRQFWPWVLISIPLLTVIASGITLWLAISNPDYLVVDEVEYQRISDEMKVQATAENQAETAESELDHEQP